MPNFFRSQAVGRLSGSSLIRHSPGELAPTIATAEFFGADGSGSIAVVIAATEHADTGALTALARVTASAAGVEQVDGSSIIASVGNGVTATMAGVEEPDAGSISVTARASASIVATEQADAVSVAASLRLVVGITAAEQADSGAIAAMVGNAVTASLLAVEQADNGALLTIIRAEGSIGYAEQADLAGFSAAVIASAGIYLVEQADSAALFATIGVSEYTSAPAGTVYTRSQAAEARQPQFEVIRAGTAATSRPEENQRNMRNEYQSNNRTN